MKEEKLKSMIFQCRIALEDLIEEAVDCGLYKVTIDKCFDKPTPIVTIAGSFVIAADYYKIDDTYDVYFNDRCIPHTVHKTLKDAVIKELCRLDHISNLEAIKEKIENAEAV